MDVHVFTPETFWAVVRVAIALDRGAAVFAFKVFGCACEFARLIHTRCVLGVRSMREKKKSLFLKRWDGNHADRKPKRLAVFRGFFP